MFCPLCKSGHIGTVSTNAKDCNVRLLATSEEGREGFHTRDFV